MAGGTPGTGRSALAGLATPGGRGLRAAETVVRRHVALEPTPGSESRRRRSPRPPRRRAGSTRGRGKSDVRVRAASRRLLDVKVVPLVKKRTPSLGIRRAFQS